MAAAVAVLVVAGASGVADDATDNDLKALAGKWIVDRVIQPDGKAMPLHGNEEIAFDMQFFVKKGKYHKHPRNSAYPDEDGTFKIDPAPRPKALDLSDDAGGGAVSEPAIYKFQGDELWICSYDQAAGNEEKTKRAASFKGQQIFVFKRPK
jgi:uncharacterized protein (TIGR03067 family)